MEIGIRRPEGSSVSKHTGDQTRRTITTIGAGDPTTYPEKDIQDKYGTVHRS